MVENKIEQIKIKPIKPPEFKPKILKGFKQGKSVCLSLTKFGIKLGHEYFVSGERKDGMLVLTIMEV